MASHNGHRQRMKAEFMVRADTFPEHKVLELMLFYANPRGDTNPLAHELLARFGSIQGVLDANPDELKKLRGVGAHTVTLLKAVKEMAVRYYTERTDVCSVALTTQDYYTVLRRHFFGSRVEQSHLLCMDGKHKILGARLIGLGDVGSVAVSLRAVVEAAISINAAVVVLAHNHVAGLALPSKQDIIFTKDLAVFLQQVGIYLADHLVFVDDDMVSMRESGFYQTGE